MEPAIALDQIKRKAPRAPVMEKQMGRRQDEGEEDWTDYQPKIELVKPAVAPAPNLGRLVGREEAARLLAGDQATGDLDGGAYDPKFDFIRPAAPSIGFALAEDRQDAMERAMRGTEGGDILLLNPRHPSTIGFEQKVFVGEHSKEPFGRIRDRWADDDDLDVDEGNVLMLHTSMDDISKARRPRAANPVVPKWTTPGPALPRESFEILSLTPGEHRPARRMREAMGPDEALVARRIETLMTNEPSSNIVLDAVRGDPRGQVADDLRRRERVWDRLGQVGRQEVSHVRDSGVADGDLKPRDQALMRRLQAEERERKEERIRGGIQRQSILPSREMTETPLPEKIKVPPWNLQVPESQPPPLPKFPPPRPPSLQVARSLRETSGWGKLRGLFRDTTVARQREEVQGPNTSSWSLSYEGTGA